MFRASTVSIEPFSLSNLLKIPLNKLVLSIDMSIIKSTLNII